MSSTPGQTIPGDGKHDVVEQFQHVEHAKEHIEENLTYEEDQEPELHAQTYFALAAMFLLNLVQVFGLLSPPAAVLESSPALQSIGKLTLFC